MKLIVKEYVKSLTERDELDRLVPDVLSQAGLHVFSEPRVMGRQHGVDVAAFGRLDGDSVDKVYLLSIKPGDLKRDSWNAGVNALRPSLDEIVDSYIGHMLPKEYSGHPIVICLCIGGMVCHLVQGDVSGYIGNCQARRPDITYKIWECDKIAELCVKYLMDERLAITVKSESLGRCISLPDEIDYYMENFKKLINDIFASGEVARTSSPEFHVQSLNLCLAILFHQSKVAGNLDGAYLAAEYALLMVWRHLGLSSVKKRKGKRLVLFDQTYRLFFRIGHEYFSKIAFSFEKPFMFALSIPNASDEVDVNIRAFDVLGRLSSYAIALDEYIDKSQAAMGDDFKSEVDNVLSMVAKMIANVHTLTTPLMDDQLSSISQATAFLVRHGKDDEVGNWIMGMAMSIWGCLMIRKGYPTIGCDYEQLLDHVHIDHDEEYRHETWPASELIPFLYFVSSRLGRQDCLQKIQEIVQLIPDCALQVWFPDADTESKICESEVQLTGRMLHPVGVRGNQDCLIVIPSVAASHKGTFSFEGTPYFGLSYIGCRRSALPLPPWLWPFFEDLA